MDESKHNMKEEDVRQQLNRIEEMLRLLISDKKLTQHLKERGYK